MEPLEPWLDRQYRRAAQRDAARAYRHVEIVKTRPGFGQTRHDRSAARSSPRRCWPPTIRTRTISFTGFVIPRWSSMHCACCIEDGSAGAEALAQFSDFVHFSLSLQAARRARAGRDCGLARREWRPTSVKFLRTDDGSRGRARRGGRRRDPRQSGRHARHLELGAPAARRPGTARADAAALAAQRAAAGADLSAAVSTLLRSDLAYTRSTGASLASTSGRRKRACTTTRCASPARRSARRGLAADSSGDAGAGAALAAEARRFAGCSMSYWLADHGYYRSRVLASGAALRQGTRHRRHAGRDARRRGGNGRTRCTIRRCMPRSRGSRRCSMPPTRSIVTDRRTPGAGHGPLCRRCLLFRRRVLFLDAGRGRILLSRGRGAGRDGSAWSARGDAYLQTVRAYTPPSGDMSEQFDQRTGAQTSARHLAWSYAAFISCIAARRRSYRRGSCLPHSSCRTMVLSANGDPSQPAASGSARQRRSRCRRRCPLRPDAPAGHDAPGAAGLASWQELHAGCWS